MTPFVNIYFYVNIVKIKDLNKGIKTVRLTLAKIVLEYVSVKIKDLNKGIKTFFTLEKEIVVDFKVKIKDLNKGIKTQLSNYIFYIAHFL